MGVSEHPRRGRPTADEARALDDRVRRAALDAFVATGFDGTTMEAVAAAAGVTKRTLYAKYSDKRSLFASVIPWGLAQMPLAGEALDVPDGDLETALRSLAQQVVARLVEPQAVKLRRLAVLESHRFPEFAERANADLWRQSVQPVVQLLAAHADAHEVAIDDLALAADQFIALVAGGATILADMGVTRTPDEEARYVGHAVRLFLDGVRTRSASPNV